MVPHLELGLFRRGLPERLGRTYHRGMTLVDLSQPIYAGMPRIHVLPEVDFQPVRRIDQGHPLNISELRIATHAGTHVDAPWHFVPGGRTIDQVPLEQLCGSAVVVPIRRAAGEPIPVADLEASPEPIRPGDIVLLATGWGAKFESAEYDLHPYVSEEVAHWLVQRRVKMLGLDLITVDLPTSMRPNPFSYPVHHILLENDVLIIENLANLDGLVGRRVQLYAFPLSIRGSDAGNARVVAEV
jgi:arylformamidase